MATDTKILGVTIKVGMTIKKRKTETTNGNQHKKTITKTNIKKHKKEQKK